MCVPDPDYLKYNPVRVCFYHKVPGKARLVRRRLSTWFSDSTRGGPEVNKR